MSTITGPLATPDGGNGLNSLNAVTGTATLTADSLLPVVSAGTNVDVGQNIAANWPIANVRWYAVDSALGNDTNAGFSDVSSAAAGLVAKQTLAGLGLIMPRVGRGRKVVVVIKTAAYAEALDLILGSVIGYAADFPLIVATSTNATAASTAFLGDAADRTYAGFVTTTGMNAAGYNPVAPFSVTALKCLTVAAGAPGFPAETAGPLPMGTRVRFDSATTTVALRNQSAMITGIAANDTLTCPADAGGVTGALPAVPAAADIFYIEMPGLTVNASHLNVPTSGSTLPSHNNGSLQLVGIAFGAGTSIDGPVRCAGCLAVGQFAARGGALDTDFQFNDETGATRKVGSSFRSSSLLQLNSAPIGINAIGANSNVVCAGTALLSSASLWNINNGAFFGAGLGVSAVQSDVTFDSNVTQPLSLLGGRRNNAQSPLRIRGTTIIQTVSAGLNILGSSFTLGKIDIQNAGANPAIRLQGICRIGSMSSDVTGAGTNNDVGLDLTKAWGSIILIPQLPTVTGALGDVRLADGTIVTWVQAMAGIVDTAGNELAGTSSNVRIVGKFSGTIVSSAIGATTSYLADSGSALAVANLATAQRYPTSLRMITRLRACVSAVAGALANACTATLYKNNVATAVQVSIPAGSAVGFQVVDSAHSVVFVGGDTFDVRLDDGTDATAGTMSVSCTIEGP